MHKLMMMTESPLGRRFMEEPADGADAGAGAGADTQAADEGGALAGAGTTEQKAAEAPAVDWENMTDEQYFKDFSAPDGFDAKEIQANYGAFLRENRIPQAALSKFLDIAAGVGKKAEEAAAADAAKATAAEKEAFQAEGKALREAFNQEQIASAVEALKGFSEDKAFFEAATGRFSNNATLVKLLVNWAETHRPDDVSGAAAGSNGGQSDFLKNWTGVAR